MWPAVLGGLPLALLPVVRWGQPGWLRARGRPSALPGASEPVVQTRPDLAHEALHLCPLPTLSSAGSP